MYWWVIAGDFVTLDAGTGIVHVAPAFGEDDNLAYHKRLADFQPGARGPAPLRRARRRHLRRGPALRRHLRQGRRPAHRSRICEARGPARPRREVPPRATPTAGAPTTTRSSSSRARPGTSARQANKERAIENNRAVQWLPDHIKEGRFGDFLAEQRRLGPLPRALLGHAPQRLGLREEPGPPARARERRRHREAEPRSVRRTSAQPRPPTRASTTTSSSTSRGSTR